MSRHAETGSVGAAVLDLDFKLQRRGPDVAPTISQSANVGFCHILGILLQTA